MQGYKKIDGNYYEINIYVADTELNNGDIICSYRDKVDCKMIRRNKITGEEESFEQDFDICASYGGYIDGNEFGELEECLMKLEEALYYDITYTENNDEELIIDELNVFIYDITAK